jgi:WhiB family redox-sensing transcriptional regulator
MKQENRVLRSKRDARENGNSLNRLARLLIIQLKGAPVDWRHRSACRDEDPELFFPVGNTGPALQQIEEAKKVCNRCLVINECLKWALESGQEAGVWGGLSEDERRALKRRAARNRARGIESPNPYEINQQ